MDAFFSILPELISAIGAVVALFLTYNQYTKNKLTDLKVEQMKSDQLVKHEQRGQNMAYIYGEIYGLLINLKADRVYVVQPHPLVANQYITISFEVRNKGVSAIRDHMQSIKMSSVANFVSRLAKEEYIYIDNIATQLADKKVKAIMCMAGTTQIAIKRLLNSENIWIGNICVESANSYYFDASEAEKSLETAANTIAHILPPIL